MASSKTTTSRRSMVSRALAARLKRRSSKVQADAHIISTVDEDTPEEQEQEQDASPNLPEQECYPEPVQTIRDTEYAHMNEGTYLDHGGTTIYARSLVDAFAARLTSSLYGNPHSANAPAARSGCAVDAARQRALRFLGADPRHYDLVFVANATAAVKLVADAFDALAAQTRAGAFWYGFHKDAHTSLVGVREVAGARGSGSGSGGAVGPHCFGSDDEVERWLRDPASVVPTTSSMMTGAASPPPRRPGQGLGLFAYPGQSNLSGRRLPLSWPARVRASPALQGGTYTLLDCAALAMTSPLHAVFRDPAAAPDFACVSLYKIFGFPDLGALVVRRDSGHVLTLRRYFGGGTVTMVSVLGGAWHRIKGRDAGEFYAGGGGGGGKHVYDIHDGLEDGTLPFHSIIALGEAIDVHARLYGSMDNISRHTTHLSVRLYQKMRRLTHTNGRPLCHIYTENGGRGFGDPRKQGATIAFNLIDSKGYFIPYSDVEKIANDNRIYVRSGGICCPGGIYTALNYEPWELQRAMSANHACGPDGISLIRQLPTGVVRASLGAMSTQDDVDIFIRFLQKTFVDRGINRATNQGLAPLEQDIHITEEEPDSESTLVSVIAAKS